VLLVMFCYAVYFAGLAYVGYAQQMGPLFYVGVLIATLLACWHYWLIRKRERRNCFRAFLGNHWVGLAVFAGVVTDFGVRLNHWPRW
jgi:4-hydroxybenzoate polyprenyltransferase